MNVELFRKELLNLKASLESRRDLLSEHQRKAKDPDLDERAVEIQNDEVVGELDIFEQKELSQVNAALQRIDLNRFGICVGCEEEISLSRLKAIPFASLCIDCAKE